MLLWNWYKREMEEEEKANAKHFAEGFIMGKAKANKAWVEWNTRRIEAEKNNKRFEEPPPSEAQAD